MRQWLPALLLFPPLVLWCFAPSPAEQIERHRNLGKAFYENPTTQKEAVAEFEKALALAPDSARERLNWGLALLRAGRTEDGVAELERVQKQSPSLPHTWFNLAIAWKKAGEFEKAIAQMKGFVRLVPDDAISQYNLGALYKSTGDAAQAERFFVRAAELDPGLSAPHFQLYNLYRTSGRPDEAKRELAAFQEIRKQQENAAVKEDVEWNVWSEVLDHMADRPALELSPLKPVFDSRVLPGQWTGGTFIDLAADGRVKALLWSDSTVSIDGGVPAISLPGITGVIPGDFTNDGLPDLCVLTGSGPVLFRNQGNGRFARVDAALPQGPFTTAAWLDYDHDNDLDLLLLGPTPVLLRNAGSAGFQDRTQDFPFAKGKPESAVVFRAVADTKAFDLAVTFSDRAAVLYRDQLQGRYTAEPLPLPAGATDLRTADINGDGYLDLLFRSEGRVWTSLSREGKLAAPAAVDGARSTATADLDRRGIHTAVQECAAADAADVNGDGLEDLLCRNDRSVSMLTNRTPVTGRNWLTVRLTGVKSLKSASLAEVEVKAGTRYQKRVYTGTPLTFGLAGETAADTVRITWPNGLIQNEIRQPAGKTYKYEEAPRLSGSCPMVWTWDGTGFRYITDVLGVAPLGASTGDGSYFPTDDEENIQIPSEALHPRADGLLEVRLTEELSEVAYLDRLRLIAVDHPTGTESLINEKFQSPPWPALEVVTSANRIAPVAARDGQGRDVLPQVLRRDRTYPTGFQRNLSGVAEPHWLELDFGHIPDSARQMLVLHGWVDWADGSTFLGAAQERSGGLQPPSLQVRDAQGRWVTVIEDMGMPAGKPKTITIDLTGKWRSASRQIRIATNLCVYWDEIWMTTDVRPAKSDNAIPLREARLGFRGFSPNKLDPRRLQPEEFTYDAPRPASLWNPTPGMYTRYGDVTPLARKDDNLLIVMGSGDELRVLFDPASLPPVPAGQRRDYVLSVSGWAKDRDANTAYSQNTEPLPFHGMTAYPYGPAEHFPDTAETRAWRREYQTRPALRLVGPLVRRPRLVDRFLVHP